MRYGPRGARPHRHHADADQHADATRRNQAGNQCVEPGCNLYMFQVYDSAQGVCVVVRPSGARVLPYVRAELITLQRVFLAVVAAIRVHGRDRHDRCGPGRHGMGAGDRPVAARAAS